MEREFDAICQKRRVSPSGTTWMKEVLDPMHDVPFVVCGVPDLSSGLSVVRRVKQSATVVMPTTGAFAAVTTWSAHVLVSPWLNEVSFSPYARINNTLGVAAPTPVRIGGVQVFATAGTTDLALSTVGAVLGTTREVVFLDLDPAYTQGVGRLVALGYEVINTTADLTRQGTLTTWRAPEPYLSPTVFNKTDIQQVAALAVSAQMYRAPPVNTITAQLYPSAQWKAADGVYQVATFHEQNMPLAVTYTQPYFEEKDLAEDKTYVPTVLPSTSNTSILWFPTTIVDNTTRSHPGMKVYPINQMGSILSGLSVTTSLTVNMVYYYESFPSIAQKDILTLARPASPLDPVALAYISQLMRELPVAVPFADNPAGEYFAMVLEALAAASLAIGAVSGNAALGAAASAALTWGATQLR